MSVQRETMGFKQLDRLGKGGKHQVRVSVLKKNVEVRDRFESKRLSDFCRGYHMFLIVLTSSVTCYRIRVYMSSIVFPFLTVVSAYPNE